MSLCLLNSVMTIIIICMMMTGDDIDDNDEEFGRKWLVIRLSVSSSHPILYSITPSNDDDG